MKRILLTLVVLIASITATFADVYTGNCGDGLDRLTYTLDTSTGVLKIEGTGAMTTLSTPWYSYRSYVKEVQIAHGVTSIGAFQGSSSLTSIAIPNSVTNIGRNAFSQCSSLTSINIPSSVKSIGERAFEGCSSLTSIAIPNSATSIGERAFYKCI